MSLEKNLKYQNILFPKDILNYFIWYNNRKDGIEEIWHITINVWKNLKSSDTHSKHA
jgi:hypothetical protein